ERQPALRFPQGALVSRQCYAFSGLEGAFNAVALDHAKQVFRRAVGFVPVPRHDGCKLCFDLASVRVASEREDTGYRILRVVLVRLKHADPVGCPGFWIDEWRRISIRVEAVGSNADIA